MTPDFESDAALRAQLQAAQERIRELEAEAQGYLAYARFSEAHAKIAQIQINSLQQQVNHKKNRRSGRRSKTLRTTAICITTGEGARICAEDEAAQQAEAERKEAVRSAKAAKAKEAQEKREAMKNNPSFAFTGTLKSQKKPGLQDIAYVIGLPTGGSVSELLQSITRWFDADPARKAEPRYAALFSTSRKRPLPSDVRNENIPPPSNRQRLNGPAPAPPAPSSNASPLELGSSRFFGSVRTVNPPPQHHQWPLPEPPSHLPATSYSSPPPSVIHSGPGTSHPPIYSFSSNVLPFPPNHYNPYNVHNSPPTNDATYYPIQQS